MGEEVNGKEHLQRALIEVAKQSPTFGLVVMLWFFSVQPTIAKLVANVEANTRAIIKVQADLNVKPSDVLMEVRDVKKDVQYLRERLQ
jgi:hypothetical protein